MGIIITFSANCSSKGFHSVQLEITGWRQWQVIYSPCVDEYGEMFAKMNGCLDIPESIDNLERITTDLIMLQTRAGLKKEDFDTLVQYILESIQQSEKDIQERKAFWLSQTMRNFVASFIGSEIKEEKHILALTKTLEETDFDRYPMVEYAVVGASNPDKWGLAAVAKRTKHPAIAQLTKKKIIYIIQKTQNLERIKHSPYLSILQHYPHIIQEIAAESKQYLRFNTINEITEQLLGGETK